MPDQRKLGPYTMLETIGKGGFSKVKLGYNESTKEYVALKMLKIDRMNLNSSNRKQVEREITAMTKIQVNKILKISSKQHQMKPTMN
jgi:serine/threonine protein kinase